MSFIALQNKIELEFQEQSQERLLVISVLFQFHAFSSADGRCCHLL